MINKTCLICNKDFLAKRENTRYCSKSCQGKADYLKNKEKYKERAIKSRPKQAEKRKEANKHKWFGQCLECGIDFKKKSQNQKYCSIKCQRSFLYKKNTLLGKEQQWRKTTYENNKEIRNKKNSEYRRKRVKEDPLYCMLLRLRSRTGAIFRAKGWDKTNKTLDLLGCTTQTLKTHLEKQFSTGMSWENKGDWHIDHIIPLSSAKTEDELFKLCHYKNLQPLWAEDNLKKSNIYKY